MLKEAHFKLCVGTTYYSQIWAHSSYPIDNAGAFNFMPTKTMPTKHDDPTTRNPFRHRTHHDDEDLDTDTHPLKETSPPETSSDHPGQTPDLSDDAFERAGRTEFPNPQTGLTPTQEYIMKERYRAHLKADVNAGYGRAFPDQPWMRLVCGEPVADVERRLWLNTMDLDTMDIRLQQE